MTMGHCLQQNITFSLTPGVTYYALPANYQNVTRVTIGSKWMQEMSPAALDGRSRGWEQAGGYPTYYFINFSSRGLIGFAPFPNDSTDTDTIKVEYSVQAADLVNGADLPFNGINELQDFHHSLAYFAAAMMSTVDGQQTQSQNYMGIYQGMVKAMNARCSERMNYMPSSTGMP